MDKLFSLDCLSDFERILNAIIINLSHKNKTKLSKTYLGFGQNETNAVEDELRKLILDSNFNMEQIEEIMNAKKWDAGRIKYFVNIVSKEKTDLMYAFFNYHNSKYGETITNSDWILKLVFGTSELNTIKYPFLQLILSTVDVNGEQKQKMFELDKVMLVKSIDTLENVISELN